MEISTFQEFLIVAVVAGTWAGIYAVKQTKLIPGQFLPTIALFCGIALNCALSGTIDAGVVISGAVSGIAATGFNVGVEKLIEYKQGK